MFRSARDISSSSHELNAVFSLRLSVLLQIWLGKLTKNTGEHKIICEASMPCNDCCSLVETVSRNVITEKGNVEDFEIRGQESVSFIYCHSFRN
jgi:hypothetical protein